MSEVKILVNGNEISVPQEDISAAIESGTLEVKSDDLVTYLKPDFDVYTENTKKAGYQEGKVAGNEIALKDIKKASGFEIEGFKDPNKLFSDLKENILKDAKIEPSEKLAQKEQEFNTLQNNYKTLESEFTSFKTEQQQKSERSKKDSELLKSLPDNLIVDKAVALKILNADGVDIAFDDGKILPQVNGETQKDSKLEPVELSSFITDRLTKLNLIKVGAKGNNKPDSSNNPTAGSYDAFVKEMDEKGIQGQQRAVEMQSRIKSGALKM